MLFYLNSSNISIITKSAIIFLCISFLVSQKTNAQLGRGCYVGGVLYTSNTSKSVKHFYRTPGDMSSVCGFTRTGTGLTTCRLYNSGPIANNSSYTAYTNSYSTDWEEINCPIDSKVWFLILSAVIFSVYRLRPVFKL